MARGIFAMEDNAELVQELTADESTVETATEFVDGPEQELTEVAEVEQKVEETLEDLDVASDVADSVEAIAEKVEEAAAEGGVTEPAAQAIEIAVESLSRIISFPPRKHSYSMEGFANKATRSQATEDIAKDIKDRAKKIWEAIINAFSNAVRIVKEFFAKTFLAVPKLKARAEALEKAAKEKQGKVVAADAKVTYKPRLFVGGKPSTNLASDLEKSFKAVEDAEKRVKELTSQYTGFARAMIVGGTTDKWTAMSGSEVTAPEGVTVPEGCKLLGSDLVFGEAVALVVIPQTADVASKAAAFVHVPDSKAEEVEAAPMSTEDAGKVSGVVKAHMDKLTAAKETMALLDKLEKEVASAGKEAISAASDKARKDAVVKAQAVAKACVTLASRGFTSVRSFDIGTAKTALEQVGASLKAYA